MGRSGSTYFVKEKVDGTVYPLEQIKWNKLNTEVRDWSQCQLTALPAGLEAEVWKLSHNNNDYVLKRWNHFSKPDVEYQYHLLKALKSMGISVSTAIGWGVDPYNDKVLLTSYDGSPFAKGNDIRAVAGLLADLHRIPLHALDVRLQRRFDFVKYHFPRLQDHPDIEEPLLKLVETAIMNDATFIHGDFNLGNILVDHTSYTMIDWTNAQMGDRRYDLSWAGFLLRIYSGTQLYQSFLNTYLKEIPTSSEDIERFEAIACLRWLLLNRIAELPKNNDTNQRINDFIMNHRMLSSRLCI